MFSNRYSCLFTKFNYEILTTTAEKAFKRWLSTQLINDGKLIVVRDDETVVSAAEKHEMKFPTVWLRDNCQCSDCFHSKTRSRKINWERCSNETAIRAVQVTADSKENAIIVDWQDAHKSKYDLKWLKERDFGAEQRKKYIEEVYKPKETLWGKHDYNGLLKIYDFPKIIANDCGKVKAVLNVG